MLQKLLLIIFMNCRNAQKAYFSLTANSYAICQEPSLKSAKISPTKWRKKFSAVLLA